MAFIMRATRSAGASARPMSRNWNCHTKPSLSTAAAAARPRIHSERPSSSSILRIPSVLFHTGHPKSKQSDGSSPTDFAALDVLGNAPVPSTSVDICMATGFQLNSGARISDGSGVLLVGGEAFRWRPWLARGASNKRLLNAKGQWDVDASALGLLGSVWPRPDLLVLGLGPENRPISPDLKRAISAMGMRLEVLDTRNAAAQYNLLATERGVDDIVAALIPIGWMEGVGAGSGDEKELTHD